MEGNNTEGSSSGQVPGVTWAITRNPPGSHPEWEEENPRACALFSFSQGKTMETALPEWISRQTLFVSHQNGFPKSDPSPGTQVTIRQEENNCVWGQHLAQAHTHTPKNRDQQTAASADGHQLQVSAAGKKKTHTDIMLVPCPPPTNSG